MDCEPPRPARQRQGPGRAGTPQGALYPRLAQLMQMGNGMLPLLIPSLFLAISAYLPGKRMRGLDFAHIALLWVLVGLWVATMIV